jgi:uncharacterized protein (DUF1800 family)
MIVKENELGNRLTPTPPRASSYIEPTRTEVTMNAALRALNRFGLGARPGEVDTLGDPKRWLTRQFEGPPPLLDDSSLPSPATLGEGMRELRQAQTARDRNALREARVALRDVTQAEAHASLAERVRTERPFVERLVAFWSNHLCVSAASKPAVAPMAGAYEREVIRAHVLGRFEDMVLASARHPAMLLYLDNAQSIGPDSPAAQVASRRPRARGVGLNENYARELMELHTVGVNGGYTQADVTELARVLTGWTVNGPGGAGAPRLQAAMRRGMEAETKGSFAFLPALHEPGTRTVRGVGGAAKGGAQGGAGHHAHSE